MKSILGDACDAWAGLEIESDRWNLLCKFTLAREDRVFSDFYVNENRAESDDR